MSKEYKLGQHVYRLPPCPTYDIAGMENWLSDLAEEGLFLTQDGFFAGFATFEYKTPQKAKYRLEAAQKKPSMWSDDGGEPDQDQLELSEKYSWEYIAKRGDFFIYRSLDPSARELNTDPDVQALALNTVKKRKREAMITSIVCLLIYPVLLTRGCLLLTTITTGTWWTALALLFAVLMIVSEVRAFIHLKKIQKSLTEDGCYSAEQNWKKKSTTYFFGKFIKIALAIILVCALLRNWGLSITSENKIPINEYSGDIPFATMLDFAGEGSSEYTQNMTTMGLDFNKLEEKKDWLAPRLFGYNEEASVRKADGSLIDGGLYVEYYELRNSSLAKQLVRELYWFDKIQKHFDPITTPTLTADYAVAYLDNLHFPRVIIRKENVVVRAYFYQTSQYKIPLEEWAEIICDSIGE